MTSEDPASPPSTTDRYAVASETDDIRVPDWMRGPATEAPVTGTDRLRLGWEQHAGKLLGGVGGLVALTLLAVLAWSGYSTVQRLQDGEPLLDRGSPTAPPRPVDESGNSLGPYVGTPAETFAVGATAITLPAARAAAPFTAKQVGDALAKVRNALIQSRLDPSMLFGKPDQFLALLAPDARAHLGKDFTQGTSLNYATRVDSATDPNLDLAEGIRARGTVEYLSTTDSDGIRVLAITTRFIWVYPFGLPRPQAYAPGAELVTLRDQVVWHLPHHDDVRAGSAGLWVDSADVTVFNATCAAIRKGRIDLETAPEVGLPNTAPTGDVYGPGWRPGDGENC
ncbi:hypothetical protein [Micromonospora lupini]|uniref:Uncharacterized protein n=1 Tax=Micromonospora lupini str. Lupac 08 TaxID=1150864 RepID=I0KYK4_9ACTN|nr:hypothetical protein [Micromonospora lupini]CCH16651.1 conserved hypothetical protein [Micromonospora lupini str. Lupac 08]